MCLFTIVGRAEYTLRTFPSARLIDLTKIERVSDIAKHQSDYF